MKVKNLENIAFEKIIESFLLAFKNYYVEMPTDTGYYQERWKYANVDLKRSYGMFDDERLVGFIINAIGSRDSVLTAFNAGTGVIPEYRGKGIVRQIYKHALPELKSDGIRKCLLEVITENKFAVRAYERIGFKKTRFLKCYNGELKLPDRAIQLIEKQLGAIDDKVLPGQNYYSWENHIKAIKNNPDYKYYELEKNNKPVSGFIINEKNGYVAQFEVFEKGSSVWNDLFFGIQTISKQIKINNVDSRLLEKVELLDSLGLKNTIDQYEMEMFI
jgi:GNAT superfamily N-acetyltransferase